MKEIWISIGTLAAALAIAAAVIFAGRDPALFVPPPESVAEDFARKLGNRRYELARTHLSRAAGERQSAAAIEELFEPVKSRMGALDSAEATELSRNADRASADCQLRGQHGAVKLTLALVREQGLWVIDSWNLGSDLVFCKNVLFEGLARSCPLEASLLQKTRSDPRLRRRARAGWRRKTAGYRQAFST